MAAYSAPTSLDHVAVWVFDLDNTLYPPSCNLFAQIDALMRAFIADRLAIDEVAARRIQKDYYHTHGTTLRGLMVNHDVDPQAFMDYVHDVDHSVIPPDPALDAALEELRGRKLIFTNGSVGHAEAVTARLGIGHHFEAVFDIAAAGYRPKPDIESYRLLVETHDLEPTHTAMIEDIARNLAPAAALGMTTVWLRNESDYGRDGADGDHVHVVVDDLVAWLERVAA